MKVLVAGATGAVGHEVVRILHEGGHHVRTLSRDPARAEALRGICDEVITADATRPGALAGALDGCEVVVSALGASATLAGKERRTYRKVDTVVNRHLVEAARAAGAGRFVYVAAHVAPGYADTAYIRAHEELVADLAASGIPRAVVRPTGIFTALAAFVDMARRGPIVVPGNGSARTNPVHPTDVAEACVEAIAGGPEDVPIGGPDIFTRDEIARLAFAAVGKQPRLLHVPAWIMSVTAALVRPFHPRLGQLFAFVTKVSTVDCVAPQRGRRRMEEYSADYCGGARRK